MCATAETHICRYLSYRSKMKVVNDKVPFYDGGGRARSACVLQ